MMSKLPVICVVTPSVDAYSETFIHCHIENLPGIVHVLSGAYWPTIGNGDFLIRPDRRRDRLRFRFEQRLKGLSWNADARHYKAVRDFLVEHKVQAVLAEYGPTGAAMIEVCSETSIPLTVHFHGYDAYHAEVLRNHEHQYRDLFERASAIVAVSRDMVHQLEELGAPRAVMHYNPYGVDVSRFCGGSPAHAQPVLLAVGRFVEKKGPLVTLLAMKRVLDAAPEARLTMIGDGPLLEAARTLCRAMGIEASVDLLGALPHDQVMYAMRSARAFVQHSLRPASGDSEGTPVAVLEASASGLPVVATRHAGICDVVVEGVTGVLVDELDVDNMANAMIQMVKDPMLAERLGRAGRQRVIDQFSLERSIGKLSEIVGSTINSTVPRL